MSQHVYHKVKIPSRDSMREFSLFVGQHPDVIIMTSESEGASSKTILTMGEVKAIGELFGQFIAEVSIRAEAPIPCP